MDWADEVFEELSNHKTEPFKGQRFNIADVWTYIREATAKTKGQ